ncbi:hypothetical protein CC2G_004218 [Coprinopsis cinerea AmutBmut pab1-1]|nr:hypothetical protein CC2G_004218 [Coprinopsis cinerea AmutBmut pab1-1]
MASAFQSFSVPTSPAVSRSNNNSNNNSNKGSRQPVTPQRLPQQRHHQHRYSHSAFYKSPNTPSSDSTTGSSTLTTPDNTSFLSKKRLVAGRSPDVHRNSSIDSLDAKDKSLADLAQNWRVRANQHGIKVSPSAKNANANDSHFGDDEADKTMSDVGNDSSILSNDEALLPPAFLSYHRRSSSHTAVTRPRAQSHASLPENRGIATSPCATRNANCSLPLPVSPVRPRRALASLNPTDNILCTPPPNRVLSSQLKMKGSLTDPPQPRKREAFGNVTLPAANLARANMSMNINLGNKSLELFDINEHDLEYETELQATEEPYDESFSLDLQNHTANIFGYSGNPQQQEAAFRSSPNPFADPFHFDSNSAGSTNVLSSIAESVEHHFHTLQHPPNLRYSPPNYFTSGEPLYAQRAPPAFPKPTYAPLPQTMMPMPVPVQPAFVGAPPLGGTIPGFPAISNVIHNEGLAPPKVELAEPPTDCSVCLVSHPSSLAILQPCGHPLCSGCLTSALNIVGEKDMECAVCKTAVADFKLVTVKNPGNAKPGAKSKLNTDKSTGDHFFAPPKLDLGASLINAEHKELDSAFDFGFDFAEGIRASTPKLEQQMNLGGAGGMELSLSTSSQRSVGAPGKGKVVLRIDNVPWDITPRQIVSWLQQPVERVHVLLDSKGKTLSHAYVEVKDSTVAGAILRGETAHPNASGRRERGSVLGKGKRARGVTITRSSEEELMMNLFPSWRGRFDGARPSLAGLEGEAIIRALEGGLLTEGDLASLRRLIQEPDSHFLKVPVLPFYSLLSILSKFPTDVDSRVFWSSGIRDKLFELCVTGLQALISRVDRSGRNPEYTVDLVLDLAKAIMNCKIFTAPHVQKVVDLLHANSLPTPTMDQSSLSVDTSGETSGHSESGSISSLLRTPDYRQALPSLAKPKEVTSFNTPKEGAADRPFDDLAKEFGVDSQLVQALAQRLAALA